MRFRVCLGLTDFTRWQRTSKAGYPREPDQPAHSGEGDHGFRRMATTWSGRWRPGRRMSWMAPLDAGFDLSICGFGQASGGARARRGV